MAKTCLQLLTKTHNVINFDWCPSVQHTVTQYKQAVREECYTLLSETILVIVKGVQAHISYNASRFL